MTVPPIRLGISRCLLGDEVRYDTGHKKHDDLLKAFDARIEWVPICPEVEAGLGVPREPMQLVKAIPHTRLITVTTKHNRTALLSRFSNKRVRELKALNLSGYVFKARSPSCGIDTVPLYDQEGQAQPTGTGLFAQAFRSMFPHMPITQEDHLSAPSACERFLTQVYAYHQMVVAKTSDTSPPLAQPRKSTRRSPRRQRPGTPLFEQLFS